MSKTIENTDSLSKEEPRTLNSEAAIEASGRRNLFQPVIELAQSVKKFLNQLSSDPAQSSRAELGGFSLGSPAEILRKNRSQRRKM